MRCIDTDRLKERALVRCKLGSIGLYVVNGTGRVEDSSYYGDGIKVITTRHN